MPRFWNPETGLPRAQLDLFFFFCLLRNLRTSGLSSSNHEERRKKNPQRENQKPTAAAAAAAADVVVGLQSVNYAQQDDCTKPIREKQKGRMLFLLFRPEPCLLHCSTWWVELVDT